MEHVQHDLQVHYPPLKKCAYITAVIHYSKKRQHHTHDDVPVC